MRTTFQIQFTGALDTSVEAALYEIDGFDATAATVADLHGKGRKVACYVSAGTYENWRPDAADFTEAVLGSPLADWPGERWVDVRDVQKANSVLGRILRARIQMCVAKGFDAIDFDNVDGYNNRNGLGLTAADQLFFNRWIANEAHLSRLSVALKNDLDQIPQLVSYFDWAVNEQCHQYNECDTLVPFIQAGKAVIQIEYAADPAAFCPPAKVRNFTAIKKRLALDAFRLTCP